MWCTSYCNHGQTLIYHNIRELVSITFITFSRRFYPKRLTLHSSYSFTFYQLLLSLGIEPMILTLLVPCSTIWATGKYYLWTGRKSATVLEGAGGCRTVDLNIFLWYCPAHNPNRVTLLLGHWGRGKERWKDS